MLDIKDKDKIKFFKSLVNKNFYEAACDIGLDKRYSTKSSIRGASYKLYQDIVKVADSLDLSQDLVEAVQTAIDGRKVTPGKNIMEVEDSALLDPQDTKAVVMTGRNKAAMLIHKKMDYIAKSKKALEKENLVSLAKVFGIFFDKAQIIQGQATENIAVLAKVTDDMSPEQSLDALLNMREQEVISKQEGK